MRNVAVGLLVTFAIGTAGCSGSSPQDNVLPTQTGAGRFTLDGRKESTIGVVLPATRPASPALILAFHGTGGEPADIVTAFNLIELADRYGFVVIAPRAGYRGVAHPPDVDHSAITGESSWNMWTLDPNANDDVRYVRALIGAAQTAYGIDPQRVYAFGFSDGGFFSYFLSASLPNEIAGFAESSAGWMTAACPTLTDDQGTTLHLLATTAAPGTEQTCATLTADPMFAASCRPSASNPLVPPTSAGRNAWGYLGHYSSDDTVSAMWTCLLNDALGTRAQTTIRYAEVDGTQGHTTMPDFVDRAWAFLSDKRTTD